MHDRTTRLSTPSANATLASGPPTTTTGSLQWRPDHFPRSCMLSQHGGTLRSGSDRPCHVAISPAQPNAQPAKEASGRGAGYPTPPPQIPACGLPAPGSCRRSNAARVRGLGGPYTSGPQARSFGDMPGPALCPGHALLLAFPPTGRLPSTLSAADVWSALFEASSVLRSRPTPRAFRVGDALASVPARPAATAAIAGGRRSPRFRRGPFVRDVASDPGRATMPRMAASLMLRSTVCNVSAPATRLLSWLNPTPHTIAVYASPWSSPSTAQHSLPGGRYPLPGPDFHRLDRASFAWRTQTQAKNFATEEPVHFSGQSSIPLSS